MPLPLLPEYRARRAVSFSGEAGVSAADIAADIAADTAGTAADTAAGIADIAGTAAGVAADCFRLFRSLFYFL